MTQSKHLGPLGPLRPLIPEGHWYGYPLSFAQRRLWFLEQLFPGTSLYNLPLLIHLSTSVDEVVLRATLAEVGRRHETLRTSFRVRDGEPLQVVTPQADVGLKVVSLQHLPPAEREAEAMRLAASCVGKPFDLANGQLWRCTLVSLAPDDHLLILVAHHIIADGWSLGLLQRELSIVYTALARREACPLPDLPLQYIDYAVWQREWLDGNVLGEQLAYWKQQLADLPAIDLPSDRPRPGVASVRGRRHYLSIPPELARGIEGLGQQESATTFMVLLAALMTLLHRYTGQTDLPIGTPIAGRNRREFEELIGLFVNTLVLRGDLAGDPSFRELVGRIRQAALAAYNHQELPFEKLVEELQPQRNLSLNPLFQVMFAWQNAPTADAPRRGLKLRSLDLDTAVTNFDLAVDCWPLGSGYGGRFEYNTDLFDETTIVRLTGHWLRLLRSIVEDPDQRLSQLAIFDNEEKQRLLHAWNDTAGDASLGDCVHRLFKRQVNRTPDAVAVSFERDSLTYHEIDGQANRLAHAIAAQGVQPDMPVAVLLKRSLSLVVSLLAVLKAGCAYVPLDPDEPIERLRRILQDIGPKLVISRRGLRGLLHNGPAGVASGDWQVLEVDDLPDQQEPLVPTPVSLGHLAAIIYTSGSAGQPKGVMIEHRSLCNHLYWMQSQFPLGPGDCILQNTHFCFDVSLWELLAPLVSGARLILPPLGAERSAEEMARLLADHQICALQTVPPFLARLLESPALLDCTRLRWVFCGGESMPADLPARFYAANTGAELLNMYGPTECTIDAAFFSCPRDRSLPPTKSSTVPVGQPIAGAQLYVLDAGYNPVPIGARGELYIGGAGLARGYWQRPDLTADRFIPNPFAPAGSRLYKSGDLARRLDDGNVEILGRVDRQVKLRGVRIELEEIEAVLRGHPDIGDCCIMLDAAPDTPQLVAYLVTKGAASIHSTSSLRHYLADRVPAVMIPSRFVHVTDIPRTDRGKADHAALKRRASQPLTLGQQFIAPRNDTEAALAGIWQQLLGVERVGVDDNFFDLGGHSLLATRLMSRILGTLEVELPLRLLFERPTIAGLAAEIGTRRTGVARIAWVPVTHAELPLPEDVAALSEEEVESLLQSMLQPRTNE